MTLQHPRVKAASRRGVTLIETVVSMVILSGAMVATLNAVTGARAAQAMIGERSKTRLLAETMLTEVLAHNYKEGGSTTLGPDAGESGVAIRCQFDDVDDYDGWTNNIRDPEGAPIVGFEGYEVSFDVVWVDPNAPSTTVSADQGAKRITVTITRNNKIVAQLHGWATEP